MADTSHMNKNTILDCKHSSPPWVLVTHIVQGEGQNPSEGVRHWLQLLWFQEGSCGGKSSPWHHQAWQVYLKLRDGGKSAQEVRNSPLMPSFSPVGGLVGIALAAVLLQFRRSTWNMVEIFNCFGLLAYAASPHFLHCGQVGCKKRRQYQFSVPCIHFWIYCNNNNNKSIKVMSRKEVL